MMEKDRPLHIGLLVAIPDEPSHIDWGGTPGDVYVRFFESVGAPFTYARWAVTAGELPTSPDTCDAYVITGSASGVYDEDAWIVALAGFIRDCYAAGKKLVGICFGHQILAHALGGHAQKADQGWGLGLKSFAVTGSKPWMAGGQSECALYFVHQDQVTVLPPGAELLGGSDFCPHALYTLEDRALGIQGHPEFTPGIMRDILDSKVTVPEVARETAVRSLEDGDPDNELVARWLVNFLTG